VAVRKRRGTDDEIMVADAISTSRQLSPEPSVGTGNVKIERNHFEVSKQCFQMILSLTSAAL
jgi:hypothetical protein